MSGDSGGLSRRAFTSTVGATAVGSTLGAATGDVRQSSETRIQADESEIDMSNGSIALSLDRSTFENSNKEVICSSLGTEPGEDLTGARYSIFKSPVTSTTSPRPEFQRLRGFGIARNDSQAVAYQTVAEYNLFGESKSDPHPVELTYKVTLQRDDPFVLIDTRIRNVSSVELRIDQDDGDIHDGMQIHHNLSLQDPNNGYGFSLSNGRSQRFEDVSRWNPQGSAQWGTIYDSSTALTTVFLQGRTAPKMWITRGRPASGLDFLVGEMTLGPNEEATYRTALSVHNSGSDPAESASDVVSTVRSRSESTEQSFPDPDSLELASGTSPSQQSGQASGTDPSGGIPIFRQFSDNPALPIGAIIGVGALSIGGYRYLRRGDLADKSSQKHERDQRARESGQRARYSQDESQNRGDINKQQSLEQNSEDLQQDE